MPSSHLHEGKGSPRGETTVLGRDAIPPNACYAKRTTPRSMPIFQRMASDYTSEFEFKQHVMLNEELAEEIEGHFLGPMPIGEFLDTYLPLNPGVKRLPEANNSQHEQLQYLPVVRVQTEMYEPFASLQSLALCLTFTDISDRSKH